MYCEKNENKQKEAGFGPVFKNNNTYMDDNIMTYSIKLLVLKLKFYQCSQILAINIYIKFEKATD